MSKSLTGWIVAAGFFLVVCSALAEIPRKVQGDGNVGAAAPHSAIVAAMANELWPRGTAGCESASLTLDIRSGMAIIGPKAPAAGFGHARIRSDEQGLNITIGEPSCLIRVRIEAIVDDASGRYRK